MNTACAQVFPERDATQPHRQHNAYSTRSQHLNASPSGFRHTYRIRSPTATHSEAVRHAIDRKTRFDRRVMESREGEVTFEKGQLVQVYRNDLAKAIGTERKLIRVRTTQDCRTLTQFLQTGNLGRTNIRRRIPCETTEKIHTSRRDRASNTTERGRRGYFGGKWRRVGLRRCAECVCPRLRR